MNALEKWIVEDMIDRLDNVEELGGYVCDLAYLLYEEMEDYQFNFSEYPNPFENECAFMVKIVLNAASRLITNSEWVQENWNEEVEYTAGIVKQIKAELKEAIAD